MTFGERETIIGKKRLPAQSVFAWIKFHAFCKKHYRRVRSRRGRRRVAAPCICFVPWAALASCRPLPQQLLPASAAGGGRRCCTFFSLLRFRVAAGPSLRPRLVKMCLERPCGCAAMKAPVGLSSRRAVCDSRWKDFVLTSVGAAPNTNIKIIFR